MTFVLAMVAVLSWEPREIGPSSHSNGCICTLISIPVRKILWPRSLHLLRGRRSGSAVRRLWRRPAPTAGEGEAGPEEDGDADPESLVEADVDRHHCGIAAAANAGALQRQHDEPEHGQRSEAKNEPAQPPSETSREPTLEQD